MELVRIENKLIQPFERGTCCDEGMGEGNAYIAQYSAIGKVAL